MIKVMSKFKFILLQIVLLLPVLALAEERSLDKARDIAYDFMVSRVQTKSSVIDLKMVYNGESSLARTSSNSAPAYYVFNNESGPGFVIVSGDDAALPVLGYSDSFNFSSEGMPDNLRWWLETMRSQVMDLRNSGAEPYSRTAAVGNDVVRYETALWDQGKPYYNACPMYGGSYCATGCGPTAIAITMRYWEWPDAGVGTIPSYKTESYNIRVSSRTLGTPYDWKNMPLTDGAYANWTSDQENQVSRLMADIGAATEADYGDETGIYDDMVPIALSKYMKYDKSMYVAWRDYYSSAEWTSLIRNEIVRGPVIYAGSDDVAGHMFVLDGCTSEDYYHVNWGWGGVANGYYVLTAMNPDEQGMGANELGTYNKYQSAIINVKPDEGGQTLDIIRYYTEGDGYNGLMSKVIEIEAGKTYTIDSGYYVNFGNETYDGTIRIVVVGSDATVRQVVYEENLSLEAGYMAYFPETPLRVESILPGDVLIAQFYNNGTGEWDMVKGNSDEGVIESISLTEATIEQSTTLKYIHESRTFVLTVKDGVSVNCTSGEGAKIPVVRNSDGSYTVSVSGLASGRYYMDLSKGEEFKRLTFNL